MKLRSPLLSFLIERRRAVLIKSKVKISRSFLWYAGASEARLRHTGASEEAKRKMSCAYTDVLQWR